MSQNVEKAPKIKKSTVQNVDYIDDFPQIQMTEVLKYGLDFDDV